MGLEDIVLSEMSDRERQILYDSPYMWNLKNKQTNEKNRVEWWLPKPEGWGIGEMLFKGTYLQLVDK